MKQKLIMALLTLAAFTFTACYDDEVNALEKKIKRLEKITGTNEPIVATFSTTNLIGEAVLKKTAYYYKSSWQSSYMANDGGSYIVRVERATDIEWESRAGFEFIYDPESGEAEGATCWFDLLTNDGQVIAATFFPGFYTENTVHVSVENFNIETGQIRLKVHATTTTNSNNNIFGRQPMTLELNFSGKLAALQGGGE